MTIEEKITKNLKSKYILHAKEEFSWKNNSWAVAQYCPQYFNSEKFNWEENSYKVILYCPEYFDPKKYNWQDYSYYIAERSSELIDPKLYNWEKNSGDFVYLFPNHKYVTHCIWDKRTIQTINNIINGHWGNKKIPIWKKYQNQIDDILEHTKRKLLLDKSSREIT